MKDMTAAIIAKNKRILLIHNIKHNTLRIEPPGGKRKDGENLDCCIKREVMEELGISIEPKELFCIKEIETPEGEFKVYMYLSDIKQGEPKILEPDKASDFKWYSSEEIDELVKKGLLVPNLCSSLDKIKSLLKNG